MTQPPIAHDAWLDEWLNMFNPKRDRLAPVPPGRVPVPLTPDELRVVRARMRYDDPSDEPLRDVLRVLDAILVRIAEDQAIDPERREIIP